MYQILEDLMSEKNLWQYCRRHLSGRGVFMRIENAFYKGVPDVNFLVGGIEGWLELKFLHNFPKKESTPVKIPHFTQEQKLWHKERFENHGLTAMLLQVDDHYFLFVGDKIALVNNLSKKGMIKNANKCWRKRINFEELIDTLCHKKTLN